MLGMNIISSDEFGVISAATVMKLCLLILSSVNERNADFASRKTAVASLDVRNRSIQHTNETECYTLSATVIFVRVSSSMLKKTLTMESVMKA